MKLVTAEQMRELDRRTIEETEVTGEVLMERAGFVLAGMIRRLADASSLASPIVHFIAGRGNNGGDAFVAARVLHDMQYSVYVWIAAFANQIHGDALLHFSRMKQKGITIDELPTLEDWQDAARQPLYADIIVDGILGTGLKGPARGPATGAIHYINQQRRESLCVAIDIPSGLNADTGTVEGEAVYADLTVTMGLPKVGFVTATGMDHIGSIDVADIGIPRELVDEVEPPEAIELIDISDLRGLAPRRTCRSHKGTYGHTLLIGGSRRYCGAPILAGEAALRVGSGLVTLAVPASLHTLAASHTPEFMVIAAPEKPDGTLSRALATHLIPELERYSAIVIGPGLVPDDDLHALVELLLEHATCPMVLDAGALDILHGNLPRLAGARTPLVITPHSGEMGRLLGLSAEQVEADRIKAVTTACALGNCVTLLKGAGTLIASPKDPILRINLTGNPGMATAGAGDVLSGIIAGLISQGCTPQDAAMAGVYFHGMAGDFAARRLCQMSVIASDLLDDLPFALREWSLR
ncbi:MAG: NAD(P)H-hydrate dehydratase [Kiritimatiellae bacterium]|nr:NAD(P)H-hydrate dehydratase [Kiritimatiellia bacterium]